VATQSLVDKNAKPQKGSDDSLLLLLPPAKRFCKENSAVLDLSRDDNHDDNNMIDPQAVENVEEITIQDGLSNDWNELISQSPNQSMVNSTAPVAFSDD